jgi:hypothetical protein
MKQPVRKLNAQNISSITRAFEDDLATIGRSIEGKTGLPLLLALKREALTEGPYSPGGHPNSPTCGHPKFLHPEGL